MSDQSSDHEDLRALWQGQRKEFDPMSLEHIQAISRRLDRNEQRVVIAMIAVAAIALFGVGQAWQKNPDLPIRVMFALYGLGTVGCFAMFYRMMHMTRDPTEPGGVFLRRRLEQYLRLANGRNLVGLLPFAPWVISMLVVGFLKRGHTPPPPHLTGARLALNLLPVALLAAAWLAVMLFYRPRQMRRLRRDLDDLNAAMK